MKALMSDKLKSRLRKEPKNILYSETNKLSDNWCTPDWLFDELNKEFNFQIDLCATEENSKCADFCYDYLQNIIGRKGSNCIGCFKKETQKGLIKTAFMNPPYSNPKPFIEKAWEDSKYCKIVCLVKCDPSTKWWSTFWNYNTVYCGYCDKRVGTHQDYFNYGTDTWDPKKPFNKTHTYNGPKPGCEVRFFPKRIKFDPPKGYDTKKKYSGPAFGCALVIMDRRDI